jgi:sirohydrochlorin ferrochelatase
VKTSDGARPELGPRAILLVDHGSRRPDANAQLEALAEALRARLPDRVVRIAHLEVAEPSVAQGFAACVAAGAQEIAVHPWFLGPGRHTREDLPRLVDEMRRQHPNVRVAISEPLGLHEKLVDVVIERLAAAQRLP